MNFLKRLTVCVLTICLSFSLISCGNIGRPVLEKIDEISSGLGISLPGGSSAGSGKADDNEAPEKEEEDEYDTSDIRAEIERKGFYKDSDGTLIIGTDDKKKPLFNDVDDLPF